MKNNIIKIGLVSSVLISLVLPQIPFIQRENQVLASERKETIEEPFFEEPELPSELSISGKVEGTGTYFEIKDSKYLNIILKGSEEIKIVLESIPKIISLDIEVTPTALSTTLTIEGLEPNKTYFKYEDSYKNEAVFISEENGSFSWNQDLSQPHHIWIQEVQGTTYIDKNTILDHDITGSVEITADNIIFDCNNHKIIGPGEIRREPYEIEIWGSYGIYLYDRVGVTIKNCIISNFSYGMGIHGLSSDNDFINNTLSNNYYGLYVRGSYYIFDQPFNNYFIDNTLSNNYNGVWLYNVRHNVITHNEASDNIYYGIILAYATNNLLTDNSTFNNKHNGIGIFKSIGNTLSSNLMSGNWYNFSLRGESDAEFDNNIETTNLVDGKPIYYVKNATDQIYDSSTNAGTFYCVNCNRVTLKDLILAKNWYGIFFWKTHNSKIENITISDNIYGISLYYSEKNTIVNTLSNTNYYVGIELFSSNSNRFEGNLLKENGNGIFLISSNYNTLINNTVELNQNLGIEFIGASNNGILNNSILNNGNGIFLWAHYLYGPSNNNDFVKNIIKLNKGGGISIWGSQNNTLTDNEIVDNLLGISLSYSSGNKIYHNNFIKNINFQIRVEKGVDNLFDDGHPSGGNYWSDFDTPEEGCIDENQDGFCDTPYKFDGGQDNYPFIKESGWVLPPALPDFSIFEIKPVQVIWDSKIDDNDTIDLVAGKSTMIRVYVGIKDYEVLPKDEVIEVELSFDGKQYLATSTIQQLEENNKQIDFYSDPPVILGDQTITAIVDPEDKVKEANENNNQSPPVAVTIKDTSSLYLIYFPVDRPITYFGYGPIDMGEYSETVSQSGKFIEATYPVAKGEFTNEKSNWKYYGDPVPYLGLIDDAISIWLRGELITATLANISIGIVPEDYFRYHLLGEAEGVSLSLPGINGVLAEGGYWTAVAHEAGHRFGLRLDEEEYVTNPPGNRADGFWVNEDKEISNGVCFMGKAGANHSFSHGIKYDNRSIWIDNEDYKHLFKEFRVDKTDPDVLLVSGIISKDGTIQLGKLYMAENGTIDYMIPGDYSIQILDTSGQVLTNIPFYTSFKMYINPFGIIDTDFAGFTLTIPYPEATSQIRIQHNEETLIEIDPNSKLLHDAVDLIPDHGFINNPEQRRNALHNKINEVEVKIENNEIQDAKNKLEFDIKDKIEKWLVDGYQKENPEQFSKVETIGLIQTIIDRLSR